VEEEAVVEAAVEEAAEGVSAVGAEDLEVGGLQGVGE
jgi:hypothetical protein